MNHYKPVALIILDGWGFRDVIEGNAVVQAKTPRLDFWRENIERSLLQASGEAVGLTADQMGNSEVGHLNIGAGRVVYQDISRIDLAIENGQFFQLETIVNALQEIKNKKARLHLFGLLGPGGVHSHTRHLYSLIKMAEMHGVEPVIHIITDGRDTPPNSAIDFVRDLELYIQRHPAVIGSISGRYYAMDRDKRWDRTKRAFDVYVHRTGPQFPSASAAVSKYYAENISDEFLPPTVVIQQPELDTFVKDGDTLLFFNFRADRMRQIVKSFVLEDFNGFDRGNFQQGLRVLTFTEYENGLPVEIIFLKQNLDQPLAQILSEHGMKQFHAAETEKYAHVTFFLNGGREEPFPGEERLLVQSPKVATYDLKPEMSAQELTSAVVSRIHDGDDDFIIVNFANMDMVGHSGIIEAGIKAVETVDDCAGSIVDAVLKKNGAVIVTADHGNAELMYDPIRKEPHTYHTTNPVQLYLIGDRLFQLRPQGTLRDIAPTILDLLNISKPDVMTGKSLIEETG